MLLANRKDYLNNLTELPTELINLVVDDKNLDIEKTRKKIEQKVKDVILNYKN